MILGLLFYFYSKRGLLKDKTKNVLTSLCYSAIIILQVTMLYFTASRGPIIGFVGGAILASILIAIFEKERPKVRKNCHCFSCRATLNDRVFYGISR